MVVIIFNIFYFTILIDSKETTTMTTSSKIAQMKAQKTESAEQRIEEYKAQAPERKRKKLIMIAVIIGVIFLGFSFFNFASKNSARVFLLNGTNEEITIKIKDKEYLVEAQSYKAITIPEGNYNYTSSLDDYTKEVEFSNTLTIIERFSDKSFIALNPGARAYVWIEDVIYAANENDITEDDNANLTQDYLTGEVITYDKQINYPFTEIPDELDLDFYSDTKVVTLAEFVVPTNILDELYILNYFSSHKNLDNFIENLPSEVKPQAISSLLLFSLTDEYYNDVNKYSEDFKELIKNDNSTSSQTIRKILNGSEVSLDEFKKINKDPFIKSIFSSYIYTSGQGNKEFLDYSYEMAEKTKEAETLQSLLEYLYPPE